MEKVHGASTFPPLMGDLRKLFLFWYTLIGCTTFGCYGSAGGRERAVQGGVAIRR